MPSFGLVLLFGDIPAVEETLRREIKKKSIRDVSLMQLETRTRNNSANSSVTLRLSEELYYYCVLPSHQQTSATT